MLCKPLQHFFPYTNNRRKVHEYPYGGWLIGIFVLFCSDKGSTLHFRLSKERVIVRYKQS